MKSSTTHSEKELVVVDNQEDIICDIENRIFCIRGVQVMIDRDLADIYKVKTKALN